MREDLQRAVGEAVVSRLWFRLRLREARKLARDADDHALADHLTTIHDGLESLPSTFPETGETR